MITYREVGPQMHKCKNCGSEVTDSFARVFGTNTNEVLACPECTSMRSIMEGGAAELDSEPYATPQ